MKVDSAEIAYLAVADARGHLMRSHLISQLLARQNISVRVITTSPEGQRFLDELGTESRLISDHFRVEFRPGHVLDRSATERRILRYLIDPTRAAVDLHRLAELTDG